MLIYGYLVVKNHGTLCCGITRVKNNLIDRSRVFPFQHAQDMRSLIFYYIVLFSSLPFLSDNDFHIHCNTFLFG